MELIKRLREIAEGIREPVCNKAADLIESQAAEIETLEPALEALKGLK